MLIKRPVLLCAIAHGLLVRRIRTIACVTAYCFVFTADNLAGELGKAKLSEKSIEVLGGRLSIRMPQGAKKEARSFDIMSAPAPEEHEARLVFDAGQGATGVDGGSVLRLRR